MASINTTFKLVTFDNIDQVLEALAPTVAMLSPLIVRSLSASALLRRPQGVGIFDAI